MADIILAPKLRFIEFDNVWIENKLEDVATFSKGKGISKSDIDENGSIECIRYGELYTHYNETISEVKSKTNLNPNGLVFSDKNDVIIPASGETQLDIATASCIMKDDIALGGDLNIIKIKFDGVFLSYYLNNKKKYDIARLSQGVSVVHLYSSQLKTLKLNLPSLPEQQKIASFLSVVDKKIEQLSKKKTFLETYKKGVMQKIFSQELRFKQDDGSNYPDWEEKKLSEIGNIITGKTPKTSIKNLWGGNVQFVTPTDIVEGEKYQNDTKRYVVETKTTKILPANSIIYTCIASIGKMSLSTKYLL